MPWKTMDVQEQRVQFVVAAKRREKSFTALCKEFGVSRPTGGLWVLVYYCRTLIRELDLAIQRSTAVERWIAD